MMTRNAKKHILAPSQVTACIVALLIAVAFSASQASAQSFFNLRCNGPAANGSEVPLTWNVDDDEGSGLQWGGIAACGLPGNYTGGSGEAFCVNPSAIGPEFDTTLETNNFTLVGATSALLKFKMNYQDFAAGGDQLDVEVSINGGSTWTLVGVANVDYGTPLGTGFDAVVNLIPFLGEDEVRVRFRYYDPGAAPDQGEYVQIDDIELECAGGADIQTDVTADKTVLIEGETFTYQTIFRNAGPQDAPDLVAAVSVPQGLTVLSSSISQGILGPAIAEGVLGSSVGTVLNGNEVLLSITARAGIAPEVALEIVSPPIASGSYDSFGATFGPPIAPGTSVSGLVILAQDGVSNEDDACEPLINAGEITGNIALVDSSSFCEKDEQVKNAQDAGATAVIVMADDSSGAGILPFPTTSPLLDLLGDFNPMASSGMVVDPITIPSIIVNYLTGQTLRNNLVNSVNVRIQGVQVVAQELSILGFAISDAFDPDLGDGFFGLLYSEGTDNLEVEKITVLRDTDSDATPDINDGCPQDPLKVTGSTCGCGIGEADANANGIIDCLSSEELKDKIARAKKLVKQIKQLSPTGNAKKDRARRKQQKLAKTELKTLLAEIVALVGNPTLPILTTNSNVDLKELASIAQKAGRKALRTGSANFPANKKKARRGLNKLGKALV